MSKVDAVEQESNPNYEKEQEEQIKLKEQFDAKKKAQDIKDAIKLLRENGFSVAII